MVSKKTKAKVKPRVQADLAIVADCGKDGVEPVYATAYLLMDRAYVLIEPAGARRLRVTLRPKAGRSARELAALKSAFDSELASQKVRWTVARNNKSVREYIAENALSLAAEYAARPAAGTAPTTEELTDAQKSEIERLIAEVETEISQMNDKKQRPDAKSTALSWEAAQAAQKDGLTS